MLLNLQKDPRDHSSCALTYNEQEGWIEATWRGFVDPTEARRGADAYLLHAAHTPCTFLLNNNAGLRGPWFDSLDWLLEAWVPQAARLGLQYVAHIVQADRHTDIFTEHEHGHIPLPFELQLFQDAEVAREWLRAMRVAHSGQPSR